jgi:hypothetical protein
MPLLVDYLKQLKKHKKNFQQIPTDTGNNASTWPQGLGQLTMKGIRDQFRLGRLLRQHYRGIVGNLLIFYRKINYQIQFYIRSFLIHPF